MKTDISLHPAQGCWEDGRGYNLSGLTLRNCEARCAVSAMRREAGTHTEMALCSEDGTHSHEDPAAPLSGDFRLGQPHSDNNSLSAASWTRMSLPPQHSAFVRLCGGGGTVRRFIPLYPQENLPQITATSTPSPQYAFNFITGLYHPPHSTATTADNGRVNIFWKVCLGVGLAKDVMDNKS